MPNGITHNVTGLAVGFVTSLAIQGSDPRREKIEIGELILHSGVSLAVARLPDIIEPPTSPNHRGFFHSWLIVIALIFSGAFLWKEMKAERQKLGEEAFSWKLFWMSIAFLFIVVYLVHLILDAFTPKGLP